MKTNTTKSISVIFFIAILSALASIAGISRQSENPGVLLRAAIEKEEVDGNLKAAIDLYKQIVDKFGDNRSIAAKALLRLGGCYEKLGERQSSLAQKAYEKVVADYPDQADAVNLAKEKLAAFLRARAAGEKGGREHRITKIHEDTGRAGWLSPDGTKLVLVDYKTNTLWLRDVVSDKEVCLIPPPSPITDCFWSPDSKLIAYYAYSGDVKIVPAGGGQPRTLIPWDAELQKAGRYPWPMGWTADSRKLIFQVSTRQTAEGLYAIPVQGGPWEEIYKFPDPQQAKERGESLTLSPDGKFLAYQSTRGGNQDIYVMPARGGESVRITDDPAHDGSPKWSYDGRWLAFDSDRTGRGETWVIRITPDGRPGSGPAQATRGGGNATWTRDGRIAYSTETGQIRVYISNMEGSQETPLTKLKDLTLSPRWSPDGTTMAFAASYGSLAKQTAVSTVSVNGGDEKFLAVGMFPAWSPNGREIAFCSPLSRVGETSPHRAIISVISAVGGEPREIMNYHGELGGLDWSPDGRQIVFSYRRMKDSPHPIPDCREEGGDIYIISTTGGEPRRLIRTDSKDQAFESPRWSPDGKRIAYLWMNLKGVAESGEFNEPPRIYIMNIEGGERKLVTDENPYLWFSWTPDGKSIVFTDSRREIYKVSAEGGKAEKLNIKGGAPDVSPDGKKIAFYRSSENRVEFWLAEGFLPKESPAKNAPEGLTIRQVPSPLGTEVAGAVSPDGKYLADFGGGSRCDVWISDVLTGKQRFLTTEGQTCSQFAYLPKWSPDSKKLAFTWSGADGTAELRVVALDGSAPRILVPGSAGIWYEVQDWYPDGKLILVGALSYSTQKWGLSLVNVADGSLRSLRADIPFVPVDCRFSPDGSAIAYSRAPGGDEGQRDIYLLSADGSRESPLVQHPADDALLGWLPGGTGILFASDRAGTADL
jgi:Tol biopolymer transport system component